MLVAKFVECLHEYKRAKLNLHNSLDAPHSRPTRSRLRLARGTASNRRNRHAALVRVELFRTERISLIKSRTRTRGEFSMLESERRTE